MLTTTTKRSAAATILAAVALASPGGGSAPFVRAFDYTPFIDGDDAALNLIDSATGIEGLQTIFIGDATLVLVDGVEWIKNEDGGNSSSSLLKWETSVNGIVQDSGEIDLSVYDRELPTSIEAGSIQVDKKQTSTVSVTVMIEGDEELSSTHEASYQTFRAGVSLIPLILILVMALCTRMVEISLFLGVFLGATIITGSVNIGFKETCSTFLIGALTNEGHVYIILFTVFLSGAVGMMQKSGGMLGFTRDISRVATTPRTGQYACMAVGILIFFDDYSNVLLAGETMRPLLDVLSVSREKLAFIVDATSAPVASISPISSWVGFEVNLIQEAIDKLEKKYDGELSLAPTGFAIFLQSIRYSYYSFFMLVLIALVIGFQRDFGPMLVAERKVRVYDLTDGGPGKGKTAEKEGDGENQPVEDQPLLGHNMLIPVLLLVIFTFVLLVETGTVPGTEQTFMEKIEGSDSYSALLWGTMATALLTLILYLVQITVPGTGKLVLPTPSVIWDMMPWRAAKVEEEGRVPPRFLMSIGESIEAFLFGMGRIFLAIIVLTLAWASGAVMGAIGTDRLFAAWIVGGAIPYQLLPMLTFVIALLMALATGTSWGTMTILFPLILVPTYDASGGNAEIFYATVSAVMGGAVAGDHMSPISDTTVISSLACDVTLMQHVTTQAPYVFWVVFFAIVFGYIPVGYGAYPNIVALLLGFAASVLVVYFFCVPVMSPTGRWDPITMLCCGRKAELQQLSSDCVKKANGETFIGSEGPEEHDVKKLDDDDDEWKGKEKALEVEEVDDDGTS